MLASALRRFAGHAPVMATAVVSSVVLLPAIGLAATISFVPSSSEIACDEQISIDVLIDGVADLRAFSLELEFNPTLLDLISVGAGPDLVGAPCPHFFHDFPYVSGASAFMFDGAGLGCSVAGPSRVATLVFEGASEGLGLLDCRFADLRNSLNLPVASTCSDATILVSCPVAVDEEAWGTLKARWR